MTKFQIRTLYKRFQLLLMIALLPNLTLLMAWLLTFCYFDIQSVFKHTGFQVIVALFVFAGLLINLMIEDRDLY